LQDVRLHGTPKPNEDLFARDHFESNIVYYNAKMALVNLSRERYEITQTTHNIQTHVDQMILEAIEIS